jgi:hypothetical protein
LQFYLIQDSTSPDVPTFAPNAQSKMSVIASRVKNLQHMVSVFGQQCHNKVVVEEEADYLIDEQFPISLFYTQCCNTSQCKAAYCQLMLEK